MENREKLIKFKHLLLTTAIFVMEKNSKRNFSVVPVELQAQAEGKRPRKNVGFED